MAPGSGPLGPGDPRNPAFGRPRSGHSVATPSPVRNLMMSKRSRRVGVESQYRSEILRSPRSMRRSYRRASPSWASYTRLRGGPRVESRAWPAPGRFEAPHSSHPRCQCARRRGRQPHPHWRACCASLPPSPCSRHGERTRLWLRRASPASEILWRDEPADRRRDGHRSSRRRERPSNSHLTYRAGTLAPAPFSSCGI